jgi:hypothetical protein
MRAAVMYGAGDVRVEDRPDPKLQQPQRCGGPRAEGGDLWQRPVANAFMPDILDGTIDPGRMFDRTVSLDQVPDGYRAIAAREAPKILVRL